MEKCEVLFSPHFDWLTTSFELSDKFKEGVTFSTIENCKTYIKDKGNGLKFWATLSGFSDFYEKIYNFEVNEVSRFDVAFDVLMDFSDLEEGIFKVNYLRFKKKVISNGVTYYFGSGDLMLRIYEKGKEQKIDSYSNWVRIEFQLRGRKARNIISQLGFNDYVVFSSLYSKYVTYSKIDTFDNSMDFDFLKHNSNPYLYIDNNILPFLRKRLTSNNESDFKVFEYFLKNFKKILDSHVH